MLEWLWDTATQRAKVVLVDRHGWGVPVFSPDGRTLAGQSGTNVCLWDLTGAQPRKRMSFKANPGFGFWLELGAAALVAGAGLLRVLGRRRPPG